MLGREVKTLLK